MSNEYDLEGERGRKLADKCRDLRRFVSDWYLSRSQTELNQLAVAHVQGQSEKDILFYFQFQMFFYTNIGIGIAVGILKGGKATH